MVDASPPSRVGIRNRGRGDRRRGADARDGPQATATVPAEPPPELAAAPELFVDLPLLRNMEKLEHFETIRTTTLDDGEEQSNG